MLVPILLAASIVVLLASLETRPPLAVWVISSLERAGQEERPGARTTAELFAARGEFESFQIVIQASRGLTNVSVLASDLVSSTGSRIASSYFTLYREHYVRVERASPARFGPNRSLGPGWYADALIPFADPRTGRDISGARYDAVPFDLQTGRNQPIWLDLFVPRDAKPGEYSGTVSVISGRGTVTLPVRCTVWDFELPPKPSLKSSFAFWTPVGREAIEELLRHRLMPQRVDPTYERDLIDRLGLTTTDTNLWSGADNGNCSMRAAPSPDEFRVASQVHERDLFLFNYTADEIQNCRQLIPNIKEWAQSMHQAGVKNLVVTKLTPELYDDNCDSEHPAVDIWVLLPSVYDSVASRVADVRSRGSEIWSYNALVQDGYSPKWLIDYAPVNFRIQPGFISQSLGLTGLLYWRVDRWSNDPWNEVNNAGVFAAGNYPGEGMLFYPGGPAGVRGVVPSIRLKQLRDGIEDYEYMEILKRLGQGSWATKVSRGVATNWAVWTHDTSVLEAARRQLGAQIQRLITEANAPATGASAAPASPPTS